MPVPETSPSNAPAYRAIRRLVNNFYTRVRADRVLSAFFLQEITSNAAWDQHLDTMTEFWASLLLGTRTYKGQTMKAHQRLGEIPEHAFERWHELFDKSVDNVLADNDIEALDPRRIKHLARKAGRSVFLRTRDNGPRQPKGQAA